MEAIIDGNGVEAGDQGTFTEKDEMVSADTASGDGDAKARTVAPYEAAETAAGHPVGCERPRLQRLQTLQVLAFRVPNYHTPDANHEAATR